MNDCRNVEKMLLAYLEKQLTDRENYIVRNHLEKCEECGKKLEFFRGITSLAKQYEMQEVPSEIKQSILDAIGNKEQHKSIGLLKYLFSMPRIVRFGIAGILFVIAVNALTPRIIGKMDTPKQIIAKKELAALANALYIYSENNVVYPSTSQGLRALFEDPKKYKDNSAPASNWNGPYIHRKKFPFLDPWGYQYQYVCPGKKNISEFDLFSLGMDGKPGGIGMNADIYLSVQSD